MNDSLATHPTAPAPLEDFLRQYAETVDGVWEAVEPHPLRWFPPPQGQREHTTDIRMNTLVEEPSASPQLPHETRRRSFPNAAGVRLPS